MDNVILLLSILSSAGLPFSIWLYINTRKTNVQKARKAIFDDLVLNIINGIRINKFILEAVINARCREYNIRAIIISKSSILEDLVPRVMHESLLLKNEKENIIQQLNHIYKEDKLAEANTDVDQLSHGPVESIKRNDKLTTFLPIFGIFTLILEVMGFGLGSMRIGSVGKIHWIDHLVIFNLVLLALCLLPVSALLLLINSNHIRLSLQRLTFFNKIISPNGFLTTELARKTFLFFKVTISIVIIDNISKFIVIYLMDEGQTVRLIGDILRLTLVTNPLSSFGTFSSLSSELSFSFIALTWIIVILLFWRTNRAKVYKLCILSIIFTLFILLPGFTVLGLNEIYASPIFSAIPGIGFIILIYYYSKTKMSKISLMLICGGGLSNIINRLWYPGVINFIDVGIGEGYRWYIFALGDVFITVGAFLLLGVKSRIFDLDK